ncbi:MAG: hypothetical protein HYX78_03455, partial [Armatimonadetes bacterium]|nr:hypothetical protein [Armatimonadota bacterium]
MKRLKACGLSIACLILLFAIISAPAGAQMNLARDAVASANVKPEEAWSANDHDVSTGWRPDVVQIGDWVALQFFEPVTLGTV